MSGFISLPGPLNALNTANPLDSLFRPARMIGPIIADVTVRERMVDRLVITEHPVEQGAAITDHAYKRPTELTLEVGWSNSSLQGALNEFAQATGALLSGNIVGGIQAIASPSYVQQVYAALLSVQAGRQPITIVTGKRTLLNCLIEEIEQQTDNTSEWSLPIVLHCRQIIIVSTAATTLPASTAQAKPAQTAAPQDTGTKQAQPTSLMLQGAQGAGSTSPGFSNSAAPADAPDDTPTADAAARAAANPNDDRFGPSGPYGPVNPADKNGNLP
jgi:hypothetical protein